MQGYLVFHTSKSLASFNIELQGLKNYFLGNIGNVQNLLYFSISRGKIENSLRFPEILFGFYQRK